MSRALLLVMLLAGCGGSSPPPEPPPDPLPAYQRARVQADRAMTRARERAATERLEAPALRAARRCLRDWKASPEDLRGRELVRLWQVEVTRAAFELERPVLRRLVRRLREIPGLDAVPKLAVRRRQFEHDLAMLERLYSRPVDVCEVVRGWRRRGWDPPPPPEVQHLMAAYADRRVTQGVAGYGPPEAHTRCDPVFSILAPEDVFCG